MNSLYKLYILLSIILIVIIIYYYYNKKKINIYFMNSQETSLFLQNDNDKYVKNLSKEDLYARKVNSKEDYIDLITKSTYDFNEIQKNKLTLSCIRADNYLKTKNNWTFCLVNNNYEDGLPHTREDKIFLTKNLINYDIDRLTSLLIHENTHIIQRYNKEETAKIVKDDLGFTISRNIKDEPLHRSNPDLDEFIYKDKDGKELLCLYSSSKPDNIRDVILTNNSYEHPYELMAYNKAEEYNKYLLNKYRD